MASEFFTDDERGCSSAPLLLGIGRKTDSWLGSTWMDHSPTQTPRQAERLASMLRAQAELRDQMLSASKVNAPKSEDQVRIPTKSAGDSDDPGHLPRLALVSASSSGQLAGSPSSF
jgi:hypothetical protein